MILREECVYLLMHQLFILGGMILTEECVYLLVHQLRSYHHEQLMHE